MSVANPVEPLWIKAVAKEAGLRLWRATLVVLVVSIAILAGYALPSLFSAEIAKLRPAGLAFGAATVLAVLRDLLQTLPLAVEYIKTAVANSLPRLFAQIAIATLGLTFAWYAAVQNPSPERSLNLNVGGSLPPIVLNEGGAVFATYLVFADKQAFLADSDPQLALMTNLVNTLGECLQSPTDKVDLLVRGYASSRGSDKDNRQLYLDRGAYAKKVLQDAIDNVVPSKASQFNIEVRDWPSLQVMKIRRLFKDTNAQGTYLPAAAALNRRAEILVRSAGACLPL